jgi:hypothetical protein
MMAEFKTRIIKRKNPMRQDVQSRQEIPNACRRPKKELWGVCLVANLRQL